MFLQWRPPSLPIVPAIGGKHEAFRIYGDYTALKQPEISILHLPVGWKFLDTRETTLTSSYPHWDFLTVRGPDVAGRQLSSLAAKMAPNQEISGPLLTLFPWLPLYSRSPSLLSPLPSHSSFLLSLSASFLCDYRHCMVISAKLICTTTVNWLQQLINVLEIWHWKKKVCHQNTGKKL